MLKDQRPQLRQLTEFRDEITLIPNSGIQILDFGFNLNALTIRPSRFIERITGQQDGQDILTLFPLTGDDEYDANILKDARKDDEHYTIKSDNAIEPFLEKWVPVPVLRLKGQRGVNGRELYDPGPSTWARMRIVEVHRMNTDTEHTHRVQLALDTALLQRQTEGLYVSPEISDAENLREFRFVTESEDMRWFLRRLEVDSEGNALDPQRWTSDWLKEIFISYKRGSRPGKRFNEEDLPYQFEHWARYLSYLKIIEHAVSPPRLRLMNTVSERDAVTPVNVDLVLDVGNSRTCGILIEQFPDETRVDLSRSFPLEIRDLGQPELLYSGLFPSRVEFTDLKLGDDRFANRSGRRNAFLWPSFVRIGSEAIRLVQGEEGTETSSGLSSPKRYLWDCTSVQQDWRFHNHTDMNNLPKSVRASMRYLNEAGDHIEQVEQEEQDRLRPRGETSHNPAIRPRFSRSSLFGFMMAEIIAHALVQINDPASRSRRAQSDLPRRLNRIILSLPTATPIKEQAIIRSRTQGALKLIWKQLGLTQCRKPYSEPPKILVDWDEASCTQLVYLYSELTQKFDGRIDTFLNLKGQPRLNDEGKNEPTLRLACIDIGGGTTDLMITSYQGEDNKVLHPKQIFREGFRVAGDDLIHRVISMIIIPGIQESIEAAGGNYVAERLRELFGGNIGGQDQKTVQQRRQFAQRVLIPLAEHALAYCETCEEFEKFELAAGHILGLSTVKEAKSDDVEKKADLNNAFTSQDVNQKPFGVDTLEYLENAAKALGAHSWNITDTIITTSREEIDAISREVFQRALSNMCEIIDYLSVDVVLLTGRPSRLPAIRSIIEEMLVVPPHRLISMHKYRTGRWYPFRDPVTQRIGDPKSTVAVGGMLITLSESYIPNFKVTTDAFQMRSTVRYVGEMDINGQIPNSRLLFSDVNLDSKSSTNENATIKMFSPVFIGSRQLPLERWTTTPLFRLDFVDPSAQTRPLPLKVELRKSEFDDSDSESSVERLRQESMREGFEIEQIEDGEGGTVKKSEIALRLHTLGFEDEYWIDTGVFQV
ncbi:MAG: virulence factor SrfB [Aestuariivita sp.]|nr:virulence factor SrfB [Aestuariivita sp.]